MELLELMRTRRSIRKYTGEPIPKEKLEQVLQAGLLAPSGRSRRPWELIVVRDKEMLQKLSVCREHGAGMLQGANAAIVVVADVEKTDVCIEDCSIVMTQMHLMAEALGLGSCWIQVRLRTTPEKLPTTEYLRELLHFPQGYRAEAILSLGMPAEHAEAYAIEDLPMEKVHWEKFEKN